MGVPGFYRWSVRRVPGMRCKGCKPPYEFDCLYLDFNGIIHGSIAEWGGQEDEDVLFGIIEAEIMALVALARPRLLLYIAIDGVAPRAKLNQQRSRRFRAAKDTAAMANTVEGIWRQFDRNAVTPGTEFMARLSRRLGAWAEAASQEPSLRGVTVVISDDRDPGEGEHKIMEVIRRHPEYTHCLVSNDADLVFLGLVSPAEHVYLLRAKDNRGDRSGEVAGSQSAAPSGSSDGAIVDGGGDSIGAEGAAEPPSPEPAAADYELLSIVAVRRYLTAELGGVDHKRVAADFVAMCCLAGNDFLPHTIAVDISHGGIDQLLAAYQRLQLGDGRFLVSEEGALDLPLWRGMLEHLAEREAESLFESLHLGFGSRMPPYRGPGPPDASWDGLSVLVQWAPPRATAHMVVAAMSKQGCSARSAHAVRGRHGATGPTSWLVRMDDARSAVNTLTSLRRVGSNKVGLSWVDPSTCDLLEPAGEAFDVTDWAEARDEAVKECFEFWLGPDNLPGDAYLRRHVRMREDRYVPIRVMAAFNRMRMLSQDVAEIIRILRTSSKLEVSSDGVEALVRAVEDHSVRTGESAEQVARQQEAARLAAASDHVSAVHALKPDYYARPMGPSASGAPDSSDAVGVERFRTRGFLEGIEWVTRYYLHGCSSWSWFYPTHYPPLCVSMLAQLDTPLPLPSLQAPFHPELQLLAVLPPQSAGLLPERLRPLLLDPASLVADLYPESFDIDLKDGERDWQGVVLLPFIDEARLRDAMKTVGAASDGEAAIRPPRAFRAGDEPSHAGGGGADGSDQGDEATKLVALLRERCALRNCAGIFAWDFLANLPLPAGRAPNAAEEGFTRPEQVEQQGDASDTNDHNPVRRKGRGKGWRK